jgi:hypothetical protein
MKVATLHRSDFVQQNAANTKTNKNVHTSFSKYFSILNKYYFLLILRATTLTTLTTMKSCSKDPFSVDPFFQLETIFLQTHFLSSKILCNCRPINGELNELMMTFQTLMNLVVNYKLFADVVELAQQLCMLS